MKFDKFIANYLYAQKEISIASIGNFRLDSQETVPAEADKINYFPSTGVSFQWDKTIANSPAFEDYLFSSIKRPSTVILADFEDYLLQLKSFLGSGKSVTIQGVGTLHKVNQTGEITFTHGGVPNEKISFVTYDSENYIASKKPAAVNKKKLGMLIGSLLFLLFIGAIVWAFATGRIKLLQANKQPTVETKKIVADTPLPTVQPVQPKALDTTAKAIVPVNDTVRYRMIFLATKYREKALKKLTEFTPADKIQYDSAVMRDTLRYRLFIYKKALPTDTTRLKTDFEKTFKHYIVLEKTE